MAKLSVIMVCRANICRSPMAEAMLRHRLREMGMQRKIKVDSAGTRATMAGHKPDVRAQQVLAEYGVGMARIKARQLTVKDVLRNDHVIVMDASNLEEVLALCPAEHDGKVRLITCYSSQSPGEDVPDPYYGTIHSFEDVYRRLSDALDGFVPQLTDCVT